MYQRILLAYDGSIEGRSALRAGAILARRCGAQVFLLSVVQTGTGLRAAEGVHAGAAEVVLERYRPVLETGAARLRDLGFRPVARLVLGEPAQEIGKFAREVQADLVVVGHRKTTFLQRWWSGDSGSYLVDYVDCSVLVVRNIVSDEVFAAEIAAAQAERELAP
jgi:nucleotide-binding universal stress UspA family protein